ncbi:hypothetical protein Tco_0357186, partial [Tanacetum coccineum]
MHHHLVTLKQHQKLDLLPNNVEEDNHDLDIAHMNNDQYFGILIPEVHSEQSSSSNFIHTI